MITGGCGFVGSHLALHLKHIFPSFEIIALDNLKRRGSELNIPRLKEAGIAFIHGDIRNREDLRQTGHCDILIEAAAEPSVMSGINSSPDYVINSNLVGTLHCLEHAVEYNAEFFFISTSRVYPIAPLNNIPLTEKGNRFVIDEQMPLVSGLSSDGISEDFPITGARSFYGSSKLSAELLIQEYAEFYGLKTRINRCGVLAGPWQMGKTDQGVATLWMARHYWKKDLTYHGYGGKGLQVRDFLHIADFCELIELQIQQPELFPETLYNVGGGPENSLSLAEMSLLCYQLTGNCLSIRPDPENRQADIPWYITNINRIHEHSGWKPRRSCQNLFEDIYLWMNQHETTLNQLFN